MSRPLEGSARTPQGAGPLGVVSRYSIDTGRSEDFFTTARGGRVLWEHGPATCEGCGCEIDTGKRNDEPAEELRTRLGGKRSRVKDGVLPCAGCGKLHAVRPEDETA